MILRSRRCSAAGCAGNALQRVLVVSMALMLVLLVGFSEGFVDCLAEVFAAPCGPAQAGRDPIDELRPRHVTLRTRGKGE